MIRTICQGGINWDWYVCADFNEVDKTAHIYFHERWHKDDYSKHPNPSESGRNFRLVEDEHRTVISIILNDIEYKVTNPMNTFAYQDFSPLRA